MGKTVEARLADTTLDYDRLGIAQLDANAGGSVAPWEDGHRTAGRFGEFEWWYFDAKLDDGSSLVVVFYTQPVTATDRTYAPCMSVNLTKGSERFADSASFSIDDCSFDRERCDVRMGKSFVEMDAAGRYCIHYQTDAVQVDATLTPHAAPWRPETGHWEFGKKDYFAWLLAVPEGRFEARIVRGGRAETLSGTGYHDHNWGNTGMFWLMHHWYWGRARIGDYQAVTVYITARKKYGYEHFPVFYVAKNGEVIADDARFVTYRQLDLAYDPVTCKHYHRTLVYEYDDGERHVRVTYRAHEVIERFTLADNETSVQTNASPLLLWLVRRAHMDPSYLRLVGTVEFDRFEGGAVAEHLEAPGLWEQMYFGLDEDV